MINIYNLRNFYSRSLDLIIKHIGSISKEIILSPSINIKIEVGLSLSGVLLVAKHLQERLSFLATPPIIDNVLGTPANTPNTIKEIIRYCEDIISSKCVLLEHERITASYIIDNLSNSKTDCVLDTCPVFPPRRDLKLKKSNNRGYWGFCRIKRSSGKLPCF